MNRSFSLNSVRGDVFGGLTAGIIALPLALAFGVASGAGAAAGLYGAIALGFFASIFGGTKTQVSGPTGPMTVVMASAVVAFPGDFSSVCLVVVLCGALQILFGCVKLGGFVRYMPYPVISGFMNGIGVIIILLQIQPLMGCASASSPILALAAVPETLANCDMASLGLAVATMLIVFLVPPKVTRVLPSPLLALVTMSLAAFFLKLDVPTIGSIPSSLPELHIPSVEIQHIGRIFALGFALSILGTIDTLLTSIVADSITKTQHNSNRELIGQGIGNMIAGFVGGLPGAGATMRTVVNVKAGGTGRLSGVIHALFLVAVLLGLGPLTSHIPMPVLSGILVKVGVDILDYRLLRLVKRAPKQDLLVMFAVFAITVFVDLIVAVGAGVALACLLLTWRITRQASVSISGEDACPNQLNKEKAIQEQSEQKLRVISIDGPFFFGTSFRMLNKIDSMIGTKILVVNCISVSFVDISAVFALCEMTEKLKDSGIQVVMAADGEKAQNIRECGGGLFTDGENLFEDLDAAVAQAQVKLYALEGKTQAASGQAIPAV